jgi:hypothetical protein
MNKLDVRTVPDKAIVLLGGDRASTRIVYHALRKSFPCIHVILEGGASRVRMILKRRRRLGTVTVLGQVAFVGAVVPFLRWRAQQRIGQIIQENGFDESPILERVIRVASVNSEECRSRLRTLDPAVVVVCGTRIIQGATLDCVRAPFINLHAGITPLYRGVHGGYWALAEGRPDLVGTTVHLVDTGIDTGRIIAQATLHLCDADCFVTYPYLQLASGLPLLRDAVGHAMAGDLSPVPGPLAPGSALRSHPTAWGYLFRRVSRGVR